MGAPQSAKLMIDADTGAPFVVSGSIDDTPQSLVTATQKPGGGFSLSVGGEPVDAAGGTEENPVLDVLAPSSLSHLIAADYDADSLAHLADGANVTSWADSSGNGNHLTLVSATAPTLVRGANGINGKAAVRFVKSASTYLRGLLGVGVPERYPVSCVAVLRPTAVAGTHKIVHVSTATGSGGFDLTMINGQMRTYAGQTFQSTGVSASNGVPNVFAFALRNDRVHQHANRGFSELLGPSNQDMNALDCTHMTLGAHGNTTADFADYDIARMLVFRGEMGYAELRAVQLWLAEYYGFAKKVPFSNSYFATSALNIPTPRNPAGGAAAWATHPDVIYRAGGVAQTGAKYVMAFTPFESADEENPSILLSDDGDVWAVPPGTTNPLRPKPAGAGAFNSDTDIHIGPDGLLTLLYREYDDSPEYERLYVMKSADARTWTAPTLLMDSTGLTGGVPLKILSPAIVWDGTAYHMWNVRQVGSDATTRVIDYRTAPTLEGLATASVQPTNLADPKTLGSTTANFWHIDVIEHEGVFYALTHQASSLELYASKTGRHWTIARTNVAFTSGPGTFAEQSLYRSTMQFDDNGDLTIWYVGTSVSGAQHRIAKMTMPKVYLPKVAA